MSSVKDNNKFNLYEQYEDEEDENDEIKIQASSKIKLPLYQIFKYSQLLQEEYLKNSNLITLTQKVQQLRDTKQIKEISINTFFQLLNDQNVEITADQYCDLCKLSEIFKIKSLQKLLRKYSQNHSKDIDFIINLIIEQKYALNDDEMISFDEYSEEMETILSENINQCLQNKNFEKVPVSMIHRIINKSDTENISNDLLYNFISNKIEERCILFPFLNLKNISDKTIKVILIDFENKEKKSYFQYLPNDLKYIKILRDQKTLFEERIKELELINQQLQAENKQLKEAYKDIQIYQEKVFEASQQLQKENEELDKSNQQLQKENEELDKSNQQLQEENKQLTEAYKDIKIYQEKVIEASQQLQIENVKLDKSNQQLQKEKEELNKSNQQLQKEKEELNKSN